MENISVLNSLLQSLPFDNRFFPLAVSALLVFLVTTCFNMRSSSRIFIMRLPPGPKPLPVLGNIHQLARAPIHVILHDLAKTYGPICHLKVGRISLVSVTSPEAAKEILKNQERVFAQRLRLLVFEMTSFDHGSMAFVPYGEYWKKIRKICTMELLSPSRVRRFRSLREQEISSLVEAIRCTSGLPFNISEMILAGSNSLLSKATFGHKCKRMDEFISAVEEQLRLAGQFSLPEFFPSLQFLHRLNGTKAKMSHIREVYDDVLGSIIADCRVRMKSHEYSPSYEENFVDVLLRLQKSAETKIPLTDNTIKDIILDMLGGGTDTSPSVVEWALSEMMKNPDVMKKAQTELRDALNGKAILEEADLEKIQYLKLIFKETFRLHPPAVIIPRLAGEDCVVHGYDIPKASIAVMNTWSLGRDPNHWQNLEKFKPDRFLSSSTDYVWSHFDFLPFGSGRRACPGAGFALVSVELMLANLIYYFDWKLANGLAPDELDMTEASGVVIKRLNPLIVIATPHHIAV